MLNLALMLEGTAERLPGWAAVVLGDTRLSYAELNGAANQVANLLVESGIRPGDRVALSCPNLPYFPIVYYGILKAGAVVVPLNVLLKAGEIAYHLQDSGAKAYFCFEGTSDLPMGAEGWQGFGRADECGRFFLMTADPQAPTPIEGATTLRSALAGKAPRFETVVTEATDTAVVLYTSGTTGQPKGAELTHANMVMNALTCWRLFGGVDEDVHLVTLPLFHSFGQTVR
jgi:long-chain acyl-CoA synthetase